MKALSPLFDIFILLGLLEASHQRNMRWHLYPMRRVDVKLNI